MTVNEDWRTAQFFEDTYIQDPYPLYEQWRDRGPVHQVDDSGFYVVCGWDAINGTSLTAFGHYHDRWIHDDGRWKLASLRLTHLIMDFG